MDAYSTDGEIVKKGAMWGKFSKIVNEEMRLIKQKEKHRFEWYQGWYKLDSDRDQIVDYGLLV